VHYERVDNASKVLHNFIAETLTGDRVMPQQRAYMMTSKVEAAAAAARRYDKPSVAAVDKRGSANRPESEVIYVSVEDRKGLRTCAIGDRGGGGGGGEGEEGAGAGGEVGDA
jgi:hypothetical protein